MERAIPGTNVVEGREFIYVEASQSETFSILLENVLSGRPDIPLPTSGGAIEEKTRISPEPNASLLAISYKGDLEGWRDRFVSFCENTGRQWGVPRDGMLVLSNGKELPLSECKVQFDK